MTAKSTTTGPQKTGSKLVTPSVSTHKHAYIDLLLCHVFMKKRLNIFNKFDVFVQALSTGRTQLWR